MGEDVSAATIAKRFCASSPERRGRAGSPARRVRGPSSARVSTFPGRKQASIEARSGKLPTKWLVSTSTPRIRPAIPRRTTHQSWPGVRRRRVSQPSIHFAPVGVLVGNEDAAAGLQEVLLGGEELVARGEGLSPDPRGGEINEIGEARQGPPPWAAEGPWPGKKNDSRPPGQRRSAPRGVARAGPVHEALRRFDLRAITSPRSFGWSAEATSSFRGKPSRVPAALFRR